ncbi:MULTISPECIES: pilin [Xanthomonas]|uniref:pilin n=1 Tax=Xanthomonas TaxID=338 RepID=UPI000CEE6060|nr:MULTISPECIES: pilin [Xanthomonas]MEA0763404.1 pilin [Xanthomonas campestris pv. campestris]MEA9710224.1 pilin [Xanthomonas campestris]MEA9745638.1 pilin [Xanthomonas campestris pv. raphani]MEA9770751.1 pilin [Xanthomonas campestris pv. raphani]MEA9782393.1 pilin [Xanthomonas campestris pv. raphani]
MTRSTGFTLIELMVIVAIIAALTAIVMPIYTAYIGRSQVVAGLADISIGKVGYEGLVAGGRPGSDYSPDGIGIRDVTVRCSSVVVAAPAASGNTQAITCVLNGGSGVQDRTIRLDRDGNGSWQCKGNMASNYLPAGCILG